MPSNPLRERCLSVLLLLLHNHRAEGKSNAFREALGQLQDESLTGGDDDKDDLRQHGYTYNRQGDLVGYTAASYTGGGKGAEEGSVEDMSDARTVNMMGGMTHIDMQTTIASLSQCLPSATHTVLLYTLLQGFPTFVVSLLRVTDPKVIGALICGIMQGVYTLCDPATGTGAASSSNSNSNADKAGDGSASKVQRHDVPHNESGSVMQGGVGGMNVVVKQGADASPQKLRRDASSIAGSTMEELYVKIICALMLLQERSIARQLPGIPCDPKWFDASVLKKKATVCDTVLLAMLRCTLHSLFRGSIGGTRGGNSRGGDETAGGSSHAATADGFALSNCYAVFLNMAPYATSLHPYVCERLVYVIEKLCHRVLKCAEQIEEVARQPPANMRDQRDTSSSSSSHKYTTSTSPELMASIIDALAVLLRVLGTSLGYVDSVDSNTLIYLYFHIFIFFYFFIFFFILYFYIFIFRGSRVVILMCMIERSRRCMLGYCMCSLLNMSMGLRKCRHPLATSP
jgi:hypothetical protein